MNVKIRFIAVTAALLMLLGACAAHVTKNPRSTENVIETTGVGNCQPGGEAPASYEGYDKLCENDTLALYLREDIGAFVLYEKATAKAWFSNPPDFEDDAIAKNLQKKEMQSQFYLTVVNPLGEERVNSFAGSVERGGLSIEKNSDGFTAHYNFPAQEIELSLVYALKNDHLSVTLPADDIKEGLLGKADEVFTLDFSMLPFFGAAGADDTGYFVVPDGSGSIINFNNGKLLEKEYNRPVYGLDVSMTGFQSLVVPQEVCLPMLGYVFSDRSAMSTARQGGSYARLRAYVAGMSVNSYNAAYYQFQLRTRDEYYTNPDKWDSAQLILYDRKPIHTGPLEVCYYPVAGEGNTYNEIADAYTEYLKQSFNITPHATEAKKLTVGFNGAVRRSTSLLGLPYTKTIPLTTVDEMSEILGDLKALGAGDMQIIYDNAQKSQVYRQLGNKVDILGALGSEKDLTQFEEPLYLGMEFLNYKSGGNGYSRYWDSGVRANNSYSLQYQFRRSSQMRDTVIIGAWTLVAPTRLPDMMNKLAESFKKKNIEGLYTGTLSNTLYSDFTKDYVTRAQMQEIVADGLAAFKNNGVKVITNTAYQYTLPYSDMVVNMPDSSSGFRIEDDTVPFYHLVLSGLVPYTNAPINSQSNIRLSFLHSLESGANLYYEFIHEDADELIDTLLNNRFYANYSGWLETAAEQEAELQSVHAALGSPVLTRHERLADGLVRAWYGGASVVINYNDEPVETLGMTIPAAGYVVIPEGGAN